jgi:aspartyl-tRNA(Asn)/glutamyl-tRNA(Gln) amidotransferase subunit C
MSKLTKKDILHVARLAKLPLKRSELEKFIGQLSKIFDYVDQIGEMKTRGVEETSRVIGSTSRFRKDKVEKERVLSQKKALSNAKRTYKGYFVVKSVFEK